MTAGRVVAQIPNAAPFLHPLDHGGGMRGVTKSRRTLHRLVTLAIAAIAALALSSLASAEQATPPTHDFGINNGLAKPTPLPLTAPALHRYTPDYTADLPDPHAAGGRRRIELHWLPVPGTSRTRPALWEPEPRCLTLLRDAARIDAGNWVFSADGGAIPLANADCRPVRRIGALAGVDSVHVLIEARGETLIYRIGVAAKAAPGSSLPMLQGELRPASAIATRRAVGRFEEKLLITEGFRSLEGIFLVTPYGIFRGSERAAGTGQAGFTVVETTDLHRAFRPGDLFARGERSSATPLKMTLTPRRRAGDGTRCPDTDGQRVYRTLRLASLRNGVRTWIAEPVSPPNRERVCVAEIVSNKTCKLIGCDQWSDSMSEDWNTVIELFTDNEAHARRLFANLPKLTLASSGMKHDSSTYRGQVRERDRRDTSAPWGECGLEGCDAKRRREQIEQFVIDQWNR